MGIVAGVAIVLGDPCLHPAEVFVDHVITAIARCSVKDEVLIKLKLRAKPRMGDEAWSDWIPATERADLSPVPESERIAVRYRVQPDE